MDIFDRLDELVNRYEEVQNELNEPGVASDQSRYQKLMKEHSDLSPIVEKYTN